MRHRIPPDFPATLRSGEPEAAWRDWCTGPGIDGGLLLVEFELAAYWAGQETIQLTALYWAGKGGEPEVTVTDQCLSADIAEPEHQFRAWVREHRLFVATPGNPLPLSPVFIAKPWGQEIWYTGVEERGVSCFGDDSGAVPIPWLQRALPARSAGVAGEPLVLLKILDPLPEPVRGELYFELHEQKREVYVVTHVDEQAWPDGLGYIRYGFDPALLAEYESEDTFRRDYLEAVKAYESIRRRIDEQLVGQEEDKELAAEEVRLREAMNAYTHLQPLRVGDVIAVPLNMPHSLQHGVRTVEFQTPVYERKILSFAQKVVTQDHWDTEEAVAKMRLTPPPAERFEVLADSEGLLVERVVDFPDFEVRRVRVQGRSQLVVDRFETYSLIMVLEGEMDAAGSRYGAEQALLLPRGWQGRLKAASPDRQLVFLLAMPRA